jgi:hypothetical protein
MPSAVDLCAVLTGVDSTQILFCSSLTLHIPSCICSGLALSVVRCPSCGLVMKVTARNRVEVCDENVELGLLTGRWDLPERNSNNQSETSRT